MVHTECNDNRKYLSAELLTFWKGKKRSTCKVSKAMKAVQLLKTISSK